MLDQHKYSATAVVGINLQEDCNGSANDPRLLHQPSGFSNSLDSMKYTLQAKQYDPTHNQLLQR
jgi:hypothetical protein